MEKETIKRTLNVITKNLTVALGSAFSETLPPPHYVSSDDDDQKPN
jgi:hypothetical protein